MLKRNLTLTATTRRRAAVAAAGLGAAATLGAGVASAADGGNAQSAPAHAHAAAQGHGKAAHKAGTGSPWVKPVQKYKLSASYDQAGGMWSHKHSGQDFAVPVGTPVGAAHGGTVVKAGPNGGGDGPAYGNAIVISHGDGTYSQYAHLSKIGVHLGEKVNKGERIGLSGNTGNSSGPHLHFEIRSTPNYGSAVNPVVFMNHHGLKF
jgi:murein DD-endopeptidase MepM/ murein hydrolase activator NlpD